MPTTGNIAALSVYDGSTGTICRLTSVRPQVKTAASMQHLASEEQPHAPYEIFQISGIFLTILFCITGTAPECRSLLAGSLVGLLRMTGCFSTMLFGC